jgi:hypothetical protein
MALPSRMRAVTIAPADKSEGLLANHYSGKKSWGERPPGSREKIWRFQWPPQKCFKQELQIRSYGCEILESKLTW